MGIFITWFLLSVAVGILADNKGRSGIGWFLLSMILTPVLGLIFCAVSKNLRVANVSVDTPGNATHLRCPACAEWVLPQAVKCKHCGGELTPQPNHASDIQQERDTGESIRNIFVVLGLIGFLIMAFQIFKST